MQWDSSKMRAARAKDAKMADRPPKVKDGPPNSADCLFLVKARARNQQVLSGLWEFAFHPSVQTQNEKWHIFTLIAGAAFALWRCAFLLDTERSHEKILSGTRSLLRALVQDNTVSYGTERD